MRNGVARYLGFAFASADLFLEIAPDGAVTAAVGAAVNLLGAAEQDLTGRSWRELVVPADHALLEALFDCLDVGRRRGPVTVSLASAGEGQAERQVRVSACILPALAPNISCAVSAGAAEAHFAKPGGALGLHDADGFLESARALVDDASRAGGDIQVELVQLQGLPAARSAEEILAKIAASLRAESIEGRGAARLSDNRFALIPEPGSSPERMIERIERAAAEDGLDIRATASQVSLPAATPSHQVMKALRFALDTFLSGDPASASASFDATLKATVDGAKAFSRAVRENSFTFDFQPVVALSSLALDHYEVLARFSPDGSPADRIHMAEELDLIADFDVAMLTRAIACMQGPDGAGLRLAVNISARSLMQDAALRQFVSKIARARGVASRIILEITESSALTDLEKANPRIQELRGAGAAVHLDDFGAGAASLAYLRGLTVDGVKIDGQYVRELAGGGRDAVLLRHLTQMFDDLGVITTAEMVETRKAADTLRDLGVGFGQGWYFGKPSSKPDYRSPQPVRARRMGEVETWS